jgi:predicted cobalt transporter CbtA
MFILDPFRVGCIVALGLGFALVVAGFRARRHGKLRNRQGAEVLTGFVVVMGAAIIALSVYALIA